MNNTRVGYGVAFNVLKFLTEKFNFTYEIINITENVIGSTENGGDQGLEQAFDQNVIILSLLLINQCHINSTVK